MKQYYLELRVTYELDHFEKDKFFETYCPLSRTFSNALCYKDDDILILENEEEVEKVLNDLAYDLTTIQIISDPLTSNEKVIEKMASLYCKYGKDSFMTLILLQYKNKPFEVIMIDNTLKIHFINTNLYWVISPKDKVCLIIYKRR